MPDDDHHQLSPRDHGEEIALFRFSVIGALTQSVLARSAARAEARPLAHSLSTAGHRAHRPGSSTRAAATRSAASTPRPTRSARGRRRASTPPRRRAQVPFDPASALLDRARAKAQSVTDDELGDALDEALVDVEVSE